MDEYLKFAKELAYEAGTVMKQYFLATEREWKEDETPLTKADTEINSMVIRRVTEFYPDHAVLGEEESTELGKRFTWVCDPVDGTMPYSHGLPISTFSLALCDDGVPVIGVVYDPFCDRLFWALKGGKAYCNDQVIQVSNNSFENALMAVDGFPSTRPVVQVGNEFRDALGARGTKIVSLWSAVLPACLVASGEFTASILNLDQPQDGAAVKVIVEAAGGKVTDILGNEQRYDQLVNGHLVTNGTVHSELVKIMQELSHEV